MNPFKNFQKVANNKPKGMRKLIKNKIINEAKNNK
jgi:hypothetical protein